MDKMWEYGVYMLYFKKLLQSPIQIKWDSGTQLLCDYLNDTYC